MDISNIGIDYSNSTYVPFSSSANQSTNAAGTSQGLGTFEDLLKQAQDSKAKSTEDKVLPSPVLKTIPIDKNDKLYEVCMELETFLIKNLIKSMRGTVQKTGLLDTGFAGEVYEDMLYDEYAKTFAQNANFGFAEMAYRELSQGVYM